MKFCVQCGEGNPDEAVTCSKCGAVLPDVPQAAGAPAQPQQQMVVAVAPTDSMATASMVLGIVSFFFCPLICGILAVVFGMKAQDNIRMSGGTLGGDTYAKAGIIMGWINIGLCILAGIIALIVVLVVAA